MEKKQAWIQLKTTQELKLFDSTTRLTNQLLIPLQSDSAIYKHILVLLFIMATHGSAFPIAKLALNNNVPPILMASLRMGLVMLIKPFGNSKFQKKNILNH